MQIKHFVAWVADLYENMGSKLDNLILMENEDANWEFVVGCFSLGCKGKHLKTWHARTPSTRSSATGRGSALISLRRGTSP